VVLVVVATSVVVVVEAVALIVVAKSVVAVVEAVALIVVVVVELVECVVGLVAG